MDRENKFVKQGVSLNEYTMHKYISSLGIVNTPIDTAVSSLFLSSILCNLHKPLKKRKTKQHLNRNTVCRGPWVWAQKFKNTRGPKFQNTCGPGPNKYFDLVGSFSILICGPAQSSFEVV